MSDDVAFSDYSDDEFEMDSDYDDDAVVDTEFVSATQRDLGYVPFKAYTTADLSRSMALQAKDLADVFGVSQDDAITMLHFYKWNRERLTEEYMTDADGVLEKCGVTSGASRSQKRHYDKADDFVCGICCEPETDSYQLSCGHEFCIKCYARYVEEKLTQGSIIRCMMCDAAMDRTDLDILAGKGASDKLIESSVKAYVERHKTYKWCPAPDCDIAVEVIDPSQVIAVTEVHRVPVATCQHGHQFCLSCGLENHDPAPCPATAAWVKKCKDDSETVKWISTNTKKCSKCDTAIEKNGGCNHMTCKKCGYEFCWICCGDWKKHGTSYYQCNRYKDENKNDGKLSIEATKKSLARYVHYHEFFQTHDQSTRLDAKRCHEVENDVRQLQEASGISWIEAQFLSESATTLLRARRVLKWSYAFAYFCDRVPYLDLFEEMQARLASNVEALSKLFELEDPNEIVKSKLEFLNKSQLALDSQKAMVSYTLDAVNNGTLNMD